MSSTVRPGPFLRILGAASAASALLGCTIQAEKPRSDVASVYVVPGALSELAAEKFFDQPWPNDLRRENGSPRFDGYGNPRSLPILDQYIQATHGLLDGFSPAAAGYLRFTGPIDPGSLPKTPSEALRADASVQLIDIDPASPEFAQRKLVSVQWREKPGVYYPSYTLAFKPTIGFPLRTHTRYALVVTDALKDPKGLAISTAEDLQAVLGQAETDGRTGPARDALADAVDQIESLGILRSSIVHLAVFTTSDPTAELFAVRDDLLVQVPAPTTSDPWKLIQSTPTFDEYFGHYGPSPNYQAGLLPFKNFGDGGAFVLQDGHAVVQDTFNLRFSLSVPKADKCPMPPAGYPIVLYAHGTGGDYESYVFDGTADALASQCIASMGVDQIFHGTRPGAPTSPDEGSVELLFFNFQNPIAARTNGRQSAIDEVQRARLFTESHIQVPAYASKTGAPILFDASRLMFFGHSQGGLNGPLYLASDASARGGVLSGSGAEISIALLEKTQPEPSVAGVVRTVFLGLTAEEFEELDVFHPAMSLAQSIVDVVDPIHYARHILAQPRAGTPSKSVYMTEGVNPDGTGDSYAPPHGIEAHALAIGLPLQLPDQRPIAEAQWGGPKAVTVPPDGLSGNLAGGGASGVLGQWAPQSWSDGHFVVFDVPGARAQAAMFLRNLADDPRGRVPAPMP